MVTPCGPLPRPIVAPRAHVWAHPVHHVSPHRIRSAVHVGRRVRGIVAAGCRVVAPIATGVVLGVLPPASALHRPVAPSAAIQHELPADPATGSGSSDGFSPGMSAIGSPSDGWPTSSLSDPFATAFALALPAIVGPPPNSGLTFVPPGGALSPVTDWPGPDRLPPETSIPHVDGPPSGGPPEITQPVTVTAVPEPSSVVVLGAGLWGVIMLGCRRRRSA